MKLAGTSESNFQFSDIKGCEVIELNFDSSESDSDQKEDQWDVLDTGEELFKCNLKSIYWNQFNFQYFYCVIICSLVEYI